MSPGFGPTEVLTRSNVQGPFQRKADYADKLELLPQPGETNGWLGQERSQFGALMSWGGGGCISVEESRPHVAEFNHRA